MKREINLEPYPIISRISNYDFHTLENYTSVIFTYDGQLFYLKDSVQKIEDVSQMPQYIKEDWIRYNKKNLGISEINKHIEFYNKQINSGAYDVDGEQKVQDYLETIKSIRRDLILKGLIS